MLRKREECPFEVGDTVKYIGEKEWIAHSSEEVTMLINKIDNDGWCCGNIKGGGYHFDKFEYIFNDNYKIY